MKKNLNDEYYMKIALELAKNAEGYTAPNPLVGAVIVKNGTIVGKGFHAKAGDNHAEVNAILDAGDRAKGGTLYVNLEPCCHYGKTPPCTEAIVKAGISRVVVAMKDPNPKVGGKGIEILRKAGISVDVGILEEEAKILNEVFVKFILTGLPFVTLKAAVSLDGKIATAKGESKWITGIESRKFVHWLRHKYDAVLVGINTVIADDPMLTVRLEGKSKLRKPYISPVRIVLDSRCRISENAKIFDNLSSQVIIATTNASSYDKIKRVEKKGAKVLVLNDENGKVDIGDLLKELGRLGITSILVEGGSQVHGAFLHKKLVDRIYWFISPMIIGGENAPSAVRGAGVERLSDALRLSKIEVKRFEEDICITGVV
ncbi:bifunctional diaminohydroxyphosphoribosylaminopyrimidine deaminase/5-amino-6-(5-phosphoribosylamino)uracil reductase RibD [Peptococcaceae bacterium]|nr:bifunctional diaminohydroxyphosphoribosylaminopyrimidine deaminase/5-amino-6-(5-phosphoribosylamino)uracil reductase RibD [Peptococcaceae bacterium]